MSAPNPIIDSHIHLYAASHIPSLSWTADLFPEHRLNRQNSVDEYRAATQHSKNLLGFVFLETDRKSGLGDHEWSDALNEVDFLVRIARGTPRDGEGHRPEESRLVLGIVPWAPIPAGEQDLANYIAQVQQHASDKWHLIKGFRYLVQNKPAGTMLTPTFIAGLQHLATHNLTFDLGVDARSAGLHQLTEACAMLHRLYSTGTTLKIIINHFCKPNLHLTGQEALEGHNDFTTWKACVDKMATHPHTYMKLSGLFSELPPQDETTPPEISVLVAQTKPWVDVVFQSFGPSKIMFGSDWPVCTVGGPGIAQSWTYWHDLVDAILESQSLTQAEKAQIWSGTAMQAYNINLST